MEKLAISSSDLDKVKKLIFVLQNCEVLTEQERAKKYDMHRKSIVNQLLSGQNYGQAIGLHPIYNQSEEAFKSELHGSKDSLASNVAVLANSFSLYLKIGEIPAPYFAWRIAVILSKAKMKHLELEFLSGWNRHFSNCKAVGSKYEKLIKRFDKLMTNKEKYRAD